MVSGPSGSSPRSAPEKIEMKELNRGNTGSTNETHSHLLGVAKAVDDFVVSRTTTLGTENSTSERMAQLDPFASQDDSLLVAVQEPPDQGESSNIESHLDRLNLDDPEEKTVSFQPRLHSAVESFSFEDRINSVAKSTNTQEILAFVKQLDSSNHPKKDEIKTLLLKKVIFLSALEFRKEATSDQKEEIEKLTNFFKSDLGKNLIGVGQALNQIDQTGFPEDLRTALVEIRKFSKENFIPPPPLPLSPPPPAEIQPSTETFQSNPNSKDALLKFAERGDRAQLVINFKSIVISELEEIQEQRISDIPNLNELISNLKNDFHNSTLDPKLLQILSNLNQNQVTPTLSIAIKKLQSLATQDDSARSSRSQTAPPLPSQNEPSRSPLRSRSVSSPESGFSPGQRPQATKPSTQLIKEQKIQTLRKKFYDLVDKLGCSAVFLDPKIKSQFEFNKQLILKALNHISSDRKILLQMLEIVEEIDHFRKSDNLTTDQVVSHHFMRGDVVFSNVVKMREVKGLTIGEQDFSSVSLTKDGKKTKITNNQPTNTHLTRHSLVDTEEKMKQLVQYQIDHKSQAIKEDTITIVQIVCDAEENEVARKISDNMKSYTDAKGKTYKVETVYVEFIPIHPGVVSKEDGEKLQRLAPDNEDQTTLGYIKAVLANPKLAVSVSSSETKGTDTLVNQIIGSTIKDPQSRSDIEGKLSCKRSVQAKLAAPSRATQITSASKARWQLWTRRTQRVADRNRNPLLERGGSTHRFSVVPTAA